MTRYEIGDSVRIDIPDQNDPDFEEYHGDTGQVIEIVEDDAGMETGDTRDSYLYRVEFSDGSVDEFRWRDLRPRSIG